MPGAVGSSINGGYEVDHGGHLTSELEGDKMVLKINKPPRNKDSLSSLTGQSFSWLVNVSSFFAWNIIFLNNSLKIFKKNIIK